jgi:microcystin-dependent protein
MKKYIALLFFLLPSLAAAQIVPSLPYNLTNGTLADANQVMSDFNAIVSGVNTNAANAGVNTNITALNGLTTPVAPASGGSSVYTSGASTGSGNAQVVLTPTPLGFTLAIGRRVTFIAGFTNTGPTTLNTNLTGPINILKQSPAGLVALSGGEIIANQGVDAWYDGTQYELFNAAPQSLVVPGTIIDYGGVLLPSGYLSTDGSAVSRTTYASLFSALAFANVSASIVSGSPTVTVPSGNNATGIGYYVGGANITCNSTVIGKPDSTHLTLSNNAGATGSTTLTIGPYPQGDCSTTFNIPSLNGRATVAADVAGSTLTSTTCTNSASVGSNCGTETKTLLTSNLPPYTPGVSLSAISASFDFVTITNGATTGGATLVNNITASGGGTAVSPAIVQPVVTLTPQGGTSTPVSTIQPIGLVTKAIKF